MDNKGRFKKDEREELIELFLSGKISKTKLPFNVIEQIYDQISESTAPKMNSSCHYFFIIKR